MKTYQGVVLAVVLFGAGFILGQFPQRKAKAEAPAHAPDRITVFYPDKTTESGRKISNLHVIATPTERDENGNPILDPETWIVVVGKDSYTAVP